MNSSKTFRKWTEEERRAHQRAYNAAYTERLLFRMTEEEYRQRELEKAQLAAFKKNEEAGEWVSKPTKRTTTFAKATTTFAKIATPTVTPAKFTPTKIPANIPPAPSKAIPNKDFDLSIVDNAEPADCTGWSSKKINWADDE